MKDSSKSPGKHPRRNLKNGDPVVGAPNSGSPPRKQLENPEKEKLMSESLKDKLEQAMANGFEKTQDEKVKELNKLSRTGKQITRKDYNSKNLADLYIELGLEYPSGKPLNDFQKN